jgi:hypothetical protein
VVVLAAGCGGATHETVALRTGQPLRLVHERESWIVERTFGWLGKNRRLRKDFGRKVQISEALIEIIMFRQMLRRLASGA